MSSVQIIEQVWLGFLIFIGGLVLLVFFLKRLLAWMDERGWITYTGNVPTYRSLGNAFLELQSMAEPQKRYVIQAKKQREEKKQDEGKGEGPGDGSQPEPGDH